MWFVPLGSHRSQRKHPFGKNGEKHQGVYFVETQCRKTGDLSIADVISAAMNSFDCLYIRLHQIYSIYNVQSQLQHLDVICPKLFLLA